MSVAYLKIEPHKSSIRSSHSLPRRSTRYSLRRPSQLVSLNKSKRSKTPTLLPPLQTSLEGTSSYTSIELPTLPRPHTPAFHKFELTTTPKRLPPVIHIKRRFRNIAKLMKEIPQSDFNTSITVDAPYAENLLLRNWEKKSAELRFIVPVYENTFEEDDWSDREEPDTPKVLKFLAERQRLKKAS